MLFSEEQKEIHKGVIKRAIALDPTMSIPRLKKAIEERENVQLSVDYIADTVKAVRKDWVEQYDYETRDILAARFEEVCLYLIENFRKIVNEEKLLYDKKDSSVKAVIISQKNRIMALKEIRETVKAMMELKMDLGIVDRHLGKIDVDHDIKKVRNIVADLIAYRKLHGTNTITATAIGTDAGGTPKD